MKKFLILIGLLAVLGTVSYEVKAQVDLLSPYSHTSDTVVNTGTAYLTSPAVVGERSTVTIFALVTENSGTTAGTLTLQGSLDGTNFVAATDATILPNITTKTATDVTTVQPFAWLVTGNRYKYYRVSYTGTGTMSARFSAKLLSFK